MSAFPQTGLTHAQKEPTLFLARWTNQPCPNNVVRRFCQRKEWISHPICILWIAGLTAFAPATSWGTDANGSPSAIRQTPQQKQKDDLRYLSSDELAGRAVGSAGIELAAEYIASRFEEIGLRTDLFDGTPFQPVPIRLGMRLGALENNQSVIRFGNGGLQSLQPKETFMPLAVGCAQCDLKDLEVAFVGYGISAPRLEYDDYAGMNVRGKAVLVIRKEPGPMDPKSPFGGTRNTRHAFFQTKVQRAKEAGAAAVLIINDHKSIEDSSQLTKNRIQVESARIKKLTESLNRISANSTKDLSEQRRKLDISRASLVSLEREYQQDQRGLMGVMDAGPHDGSADRLPVISIARDVAEQWIRRSTGESLDELQTRIDQHYTPQSRFLIGDKLSLKIEVLDSKVQSKNVVGVIDGRGGLADQTLVLGAHYDHVGMGGQGSLAPGTIAVHNGADDNASGTAGLIDIATRLNKHLKNQPVHRRVVFIAFTGEERGLLGSKHYIRNPRFPLESTVTMLNMDMIGRMRDNELTIYGTASAESFDGLVEQTNRTLVDGEVEDPLGSDPTQSSDRRFDLYKVASGYGPSDHNSFYEAGIPVLFFFTGLHNDYHRPGDDFEKLNLGDLNRIGGYVFDIARTIAVRPDRPRYQNTAKPVGGVRRQLTVRLGISVRNTVARLSSEGRLLPESDRLMLTAVTPNSPASQAGLRVGDVLMRFDSKEIRTLTELYDHLRKKKPDDMLNIDVRRDGRSVRFQAKLVSREAE